MEQTSCCLENKMASNIGQIYVNNPVTTLDGTELMYLGQNPYGVGDDAAITSASFATGPVSIATFSTNVANIDSSSFGTTVILENGGTAGTVNLPAGATGVVMTLINSNTTNGGIMAITADGSETLGGQSVINLGLFDVIKITGITGAGWVILDSWVQPSNLFTYPSSNQTVVSGSPASIIQLDTISWNTGRGYDNISYTYTPTLPGTYQVNVRVALNANGVTSAGQMIASIYKNGSAWENGYSFIPSNYENNITVQIASQVQMNGSTDYLQFYIAQTNGEPLDLQTISGSAATVMSATRTSLF